MFSNHLALTHISGIANWDASHVTDMRGLFSGARSLTDALALRNWDTSNVVYMNTSEGGMFSGCNALKTITMIGCSLDTVNKIKDQLASDNITGVTIVTE